MKKITGSMVFLLAVNVSFLYGQETTERNFSVQINPFIAIDDIAMGASDQENYSYALSFELQYALNKHWNIIVRPNFLIRNSWSAFDNLSGFVYGAHSYNKYYAMEGTNIILTIIPGILYRPFGRGLRGMYIGLYPAIGWENRKFEYENKDLKTVNVDDSFFIVGIGVETGYEWIFKNGFSITVGGGIERNWGIEFEKAQGDYEEPNSLYRLRFVSLVGYSF